MQFNFLNVKESEIKNNMDFLYFMIKKAFIIFLLILVYLTLASLLTNRFILFIIEEFLITLITL